MALHAPRAEALMERHGGGKEIIRVARQEADDERWVFCLCDLGKARDVPDFPLVDGRLERRDGVEGFRTGEPDEERCPAPEAHSVHRSGQWCSEGGCFLTDARQDLVDDETRQRAA